jgi:hypothetical protein
VPHFVHPRAVDREQRARGLELGRGLGDARLDRLLLGELHVGDRRAPAEISRDLVDRAEGGSERRADQAVREQANSGRR